MFGVRAPAAGSPPDGLRRLFDGERLPRQRRQYDGSPRSGLRALLINVNYNAVEEVRDHRPRLQGGVRELLGRRDRRPDPVRQQRVPRERGVLHPARREVLQGEPAGPRETSRADDWLYIQPGGDVLHRGDVQVQTGNWTSPWAGPSSRTRSGSTGAFDYVQSACR